MNKQTKSNGKKGRNQDLENSQVYCKSTKGLEAVMPGWVFLLPYIMNVLFQYISMCFYERNIFALLLGESWSLFFLFASLNQSLFRGNFSWRLLGEWGC